MFTSEGQKEYEKWEKWVSDGSHHFSPNFVPTSDTPQGAIDYYKDMYKSMLPGLDVDAPDFFPTGITICC